MRNPKGLSLGRWSAALVVAWTAAVGVLLGWNLLQVQATLQEHASRELQATLDKGRTLVRWAAGHGGVYVPVSDNMPVDPYLAAVPERDIVTPSGRPLTLVNPARLGALYYGARSTEREVYGRLVSLHPINPDNQADPWESAGLRRMGKPATVLKEVVEIDSVPSLRMLAPQVLEAPCMKCHGSRGEPGDLVGAVSLAVPLDAALARQEYTTLVLGYGSLWLLGIVGIGIGERLLSRQVRERSDAFRALTRYERRTGAIVRGSLDGIVMVGADDRIQGCNRQAEMMFGWSQEEVRGRPFRTTCLVANDEDRAHAACWPSTSTPTRIECTALDREGRRFPVEVSLVALDAQEDDEAIYVAFIRDITERQSAEDKIRRDFVSQQVIARILEISIEPVSFHTRLERSLATILSTPWLSLQSKGAIFLAGEDRRLTMVAQQGLSEEVSKGCASVPFGTCLCGRAAMHKETVFAACIDERHDHAFPGMLPHGHYCMPILSGEKLLGVLTLYLDHGHRQNDEEQLFLSAIAHSLGSMIERYHAEEQLQYAAFYDVLTDLPNRALFTDRLRHALQHLKGGRGYGFSVLFLDIDRFKNVNDSLGHAAGDEVLVEVARRLSQSVRPGDTVARLGGDEFTVLVDGSSDMQTPLWIAERVHRALQDPLSVCGNDVFASASIGIVSGNLSHSSVTDILREADTAMYQAKSLGVGQTAVFDQQMHQKAKALLTLETELRRAVDRDEIDVHYQPIVNAATGKLEGFEALARWVHNEHGMISPAQFIPVAEENGLINEIGRMVLRKACRQLKDWQDLAPKGASPYMSVNLSAKQFLQRNLSDEIEAALAEHGLEAGCLCLEVTETALVSDPAAAGRILRALRARGIRLYIDDFGTGYSSLSYLHAFPFHTLKIDRSFTANLENEQGPRGIVQAIVAIAQHLELNVIAEGVENAAQLAILRQLGCDMVQGFHFSRPLPAHEAEQWLRTNALAS